MTEFRGRMDAQERLETAFAAVFKVGTPGQVFIESAHIPRQITQSIRLWFRFLDPVTQYNEQPIEKDSSVIENGNEGLNHEIAGSFSFK